MTNDVVTITTMLSSLTISIIVSQDEEITGAVGKMLPIERPV